MKALELLNEIKNVEENKYHKTRTIIFDNDDMDFLNEAIAELEELVKLKTCEGCKRNYLIDNFDSVDGKKLDGFSPNECYICSRNCNDMYEPKV